MIRIPLRLLRLLAKPFIKLGRALVRLARKALLAVELITAATVLVVVLDAIFTSPSEEDPAP